MKNVPYNVRTGIKFHTGWQPSWTPSFAHPDKAKDARPWQKNALVMWEEVLLSIYAPPATGKGVLMCMLAHLVLEKYPEMRAVIVAPQRNITKDLRMQRFIHPYTGVEVEWKPAQYRNDTSKNIGSNTDAFRKWASKTTDEHEGVNDRVCVMTHQSLCRIFSNGNKALLKDIILFVDEYHHVFLADVNPNKLGQIVRHFIEDRVKKNLRICLTTATPFRGDRMAPIPKEYQALFKEYQHPMDEAMPDFSPLQYFGLDFILYKKTWRQAVEHLIGDKLRPSLFYIPNVGSPYSIGTKTDDVTEIYRAIAGCKSPKTKNEGIYTMVWRKKEHRWIRCIDLVDDEVNRGPKLDAIADDHDAKPDDRPLPIDAVIALDMLVEGSNWRWCVDEYIIGNHDSLREFIQMYGRLFRSAPDKLRVNCHYLLAHSAEYNTDEYRENFNDYLKAVFATLILVNVLQPQLVSTLLPNPDAQGRKRVNYLMETFTATEYQSYVEKAQDAISDASIKNHIDINWKEGKVNITHPQMEVLKESLNVVLDDMGVTEYREQIKKETIRLFKIASIIPLMDLTGLDVSKIDYDFIESKNIHPLTCMVVFGSGMRDINTLKDLRKITDAALVAWEEFVEALEEHKAKHGSLDGV